MIDDVIIEVVQKRIKNLNLRIYPPDGRVRISAPYRMDINTIRKFALSKLTWIKKHQQILKSRIQEVQQEYVSGESHYYLGKAYKLCAYEVSASPKIILTDDIIHLYVRPASCKEDKKTFLDKWYRARLRELIPVLISKWETELKVSVREFGIKKMKTKWGTCNINKKRIWLNLELAKRSLPCLEYVVVHEMIHLLEKSHNSVFKAYLNKFLPEWKSLKQELNLTPLR